MTRTCAFDIVVYISRIDDGINLRRPKCSAAACGVLRVSEVAGSKLKEMSPVFEVGRSKTLGTPQAAALPLEA